MELTQFCREELTYKLTFGTRLTGNMGLSVLDSWLSEAWPAVNRGEAKPTAD